MYARQEEKEDSKKYPLLSQTLTGGDKCEFIHEVQSLMENNEGTQLAS